MYEFYEWQIIVKLLDVTFNADMKQVSNGREDLMLCNDASNLEQGRYEESCFENAYNSEKLQSLVISTPIFTPLCHSWISCKVSNEISKWTARLTLLDNASCSAFETRPTSECPTIKVLISPDYRQFCLYISERISSLIIWFEVDVKISNIIELNRRKKDFP